MAKRFDVGARISEPTYGVGSVIAVEDAYTRIDFDEHGIKKFLTSLARFEHSNAPAPAGARRRKRKAAKTAKSKTAPAPAPATTAKTAKTIKTAKTTKAAKTKKVKAAVAESA